VRPDNNCAKNGKNAAPVPHGGRPVISLAIGAVLALWPEGLLRLLLTAFGL